MKRSQTQKATYCMMPFMCHFGNGTIIGKNRLTVVECWKVLKRMTKKGHKGTFGVMDMF